MRKRLISAPRDSSASAPDWLGMETSAQVEVTSEDPVHPVESALGTAPGEGWRAARAGPQTIRLLFDHPVRVRRIHLEFREDHCERMQEFVLRWSADGGRTYQEIVRQQYNFSAHATREVEDYRVQLDHATTLEIHITPDRSRGDALASLHRLQIA
jgi:hypothetical protein